MEDFTPNRDYVGLWRDAKKLKDVEKMDQIFQELISEIGINDPNREAITSEAAKKAAERKNDRDAGVGGRKV